MDDGEIRIDIEEQRVFLRGAHGTSKTVRGQWLEFYALLAVRAGEGGAYVSAAELGGYGAWRHKKPSSVGKEVARHLRALDGAGLGALITDRGKTSRWRASDGVQVVLSPDRARVEAWLRGRRSGPAAPTAGSLADLVAATLELHGGQAEEALERSWAVQPESPADAAWRAVIAGRSAQRCDEGTRIRLLQAELLEQPSAATRAAGARLTALAVFDQRYSDPAERLAALRGLAGRLELDGDVGSLAAVLNVMGLLARRAHRPEEGAGYLRRACSLFGMGGDMPSLQGALFNLALCRVELLQAQGKVPDDEAMELVDLCLTVCSTFGVGQDSAQAEITGCRWALRRGDPVRARAYLDAAERIIEVLPSIFEQACFVRARAELALVTQDPDAEPERDLRVALRLFMELGDQYMIDKVKRQLKVLGR